MESTEDKSLLLNHVYIFPKFTPFVFDYTYREALIIWTAARSHVIPEWRASCDFSQWRRHMIAARRASCNCSLGADQSEFSLVKSFLTQAATGRPLGSWRRVPRPFPLGLGPGSAPPEQNRSNSYDWRIGVVIWFQPGALHVIAALAPVIGKKRQ